MPNFGGEEQKEGFHEDLGKIGVLLVRKWASEVVEYCCEDEKEEEMAGSCLQGASGGVCVRLGEENEGKSIKVCELFNWEVSVVAVDKVAEWEAEVVELGERSGECDIIWLVTKVENSADEEVGMGVDEVEEEQSDKEELLISFEFSVLS